LLLLLLFPIQPLLLEGSLVFLDLPEEQLLLPGL
jgi:hypothetical protein